MLYDLIYICTRNGDDAIKGKKMKKETLSILRGGESHVFLLRLGQLFPKKHNPVRIENSEGMENTCVFFRFSPDIVILLN